MKLFANLHNQLRFQLLILGVLLTLFGAYGLLNSGDVIFYERRSGGDPVLNEPSHFLIMCLSGTLMLLVRFWLLKYRRKDDFSKDIPLPRNVVFEKTNDVNENIRRYKKVQYEAVEKLKK